MAAQLKHTLMEERRRWRIVTNGRNFIPQHRIDAILTNESLSKALLECELEPHELYQAKKSVLEGGGKTFAILILIGAGKKIQSCIEHSLDYNLDVRLPLSYLDIRECLGDAADDFDLRQWELIAPVFDEEKGHRCLKEGTLLPYMSEVRCSGQGSFGTIYEVVIPTSHIKALSGAVQEVKRAKKTVFHILIIIGQKITLIRKDIGVSSLSSKSSPIEALKSEHLKVQSVVEADSVSSKDEDRDKNLIDFKAELKMLATLQSLRHPNILRLLGSYTLGNIHSFLFPRKQCNLEDVLQGRKEAKIFSNDGCTFQALSRLSSAVESLHNFTSTILQVELIGCHRDIKPDNILVDDENFYLADFGLSVFRKGQDGSSTSYNHGGGYYRAPECEKVDTMLAKGKINRASDIWSFGCILAEVLTYLVQGSPGVQTFQEERRIQLFGCFETHVFHNYHEDHPRVKKWLGQLPIDPGSSRARLRLLILQILSINPNERPTAQDVSQAANTMHAVSTRRTYPKSTVTLRSFG
jgi:serine/threonine protein kinase